MISKSEYEKIIQKPKMDSEDYFKCYKYIRNRAPDLFEALEKDDRSLIKE